MKLIKFLVVILSILCLLTIFGCESKEPEKEKEPEIIEEHVHDLIHHEALEPTCTKSGHNEYDECRTCDYSTLTIIPPLGHSYDSGVVTKEASCTEEGIITYTCTRCGDTYTETIEKLEHEYELVEVIDPTYEVEGKKIYRCKVCGDEYYEVIEKRDYLLLSEIFKLCSIKEDEINMILFDGVGGSTWKAIFKKEYIDLFFSFTENHFYESDEYINQGDWGDSLSVIDINYHGLTLDYYKNGTISFYKDGKYYYSSNEYDFSELKRKYRELSRIDKIDNFVFNPLFRLEVGQRYSLYDVLTFKTNSSKLLTSEDITSYFCGMANMTLYDKNDFLQIIDIFNGEYEVVEEDLINYCTWDTINKVFNTNNGELDLYINSENDFFFSFVIFDNGEFLFVNLKGCFELDYKSKEDLENELWRKEIKEAEDSGGRYPDYWRKKNN